MLSLNIGKQSRLVLDFLKEEINFTELIAELQQNVMDWAFLYNWKHGTLTILRKVMETV